MLYLHRYRSDTGTERNGIENPRSGTFRGFRYTSTQEYDELSGLSSRKSISCYTKKISLPSLALRSFLSSLLTGLYRSQNLSGVIDPFF